MKSMAVLLRNAGLTNHDTEDIASIALSPTRDLYEWRCSSHACAAEGYYSVKFMDTGWHDKCPDCGYTLYSKRMKK